MTPAGWHWTKVINQAYQGACWGTAGEEAQMMETVRQIALTILGLGSHPNLIPMVNMLVYSHPFHKVFF